MKRAVIGVGVSLALLLAVFGTAGATNTADDNCAENPLIVDDGPAGPKAVRVANGYVCPGVTLEIKSSLDVTDPTLVITAASVLIMTTGDPSDPAQRVQIVNNFAASTTFITATTGNMTLLGATVKAHATLRFQCNGTQPPPGCKFEADQSDMIAATDFNNPGAGGVLFFVIVGPIDIQTSNVHGGDNLEMQSKNSSITLICGSGDTACKDPTVGIPPDVIKAACGDPIVYPCNVSFPDAASLKSVCIGAPGVVCNGGHKEKRFSAKTDINIENSTIISDEHVTFTCIDGEFKGKNSVLDADSIVINCKGKVDISGAKLTAAAHITITSGTNCAIGALCIDASGSSLIAKPMTMTARGGLSVIRVCGGTFTVPGSGFPKLNNDTAPPYPATVLEDAGECAPDPAAIFQN